MSRQAKRTLKAASTFDAEMLQVSERLMAEYDDVPLLVIVGAINEARRTTSDWVGDVSPAAVYRMAEWTLAQNRLTTPA